jgi:predicted SprT family Zn-dependent metalloprotease
VVSRVPASSQESLGHAVKKPSVLPDESTLQLLFAQLNNLYFNGEVPGCRIRYNARFSNSIGRIVYESKPMLIELSPKHFRRAPDALRETLLHEMIHAWLHARGEDAGHTRAFKKKMRECGLTSIYHDLGSMAPAAESRRRFILRCAQCATEFLRKRKPSGPLSCGRCSRRRYDARFPLTVYEVVELREIGSTAMAALRGHHQ